MMGDEGVHWWTQGWLWTAVTLSDEVDLSSLVNAVEPTRGANDMRVYSRRCPCACEQELALCQHSLSISRVTRRSLRPPSMRAAPNPRWLQAHEATAIRSCPISCLSHPKNLRTHASVTNHLTCGQTASTRCASWDCAHLSMNTRTSMHHQHIGAGIQQYQCPHL